MVGCTRSGATGGTPGTGDLVWQVQPSNKNPRHPADWQWWQFRVLGSRCYRFADGRGNPNNRRYPVLAAPRGGSTLESVPISSMAGMSARLAVLLEWASSDRILPAESNLGDVTLSERKTEALVRDRLRALGYIEPENGITVEEQKSEIAKVKTLLSKASKNATGKPGYPEFIISNRKDTAFLIVFECKASVKKHESAERNKPVEYAVDGVLHYARHLARHYTVVAVAVSGMSASAMSVSSFLIPAGGGTHPGQRKRSCGH